MKYLLTSIFIIFLTGCNAQKKRIKWEDTYLLPMRMNLLFSDSVKDYMKPGVSYYVKSYPADKKTHEHIFVKIEKDTIRASYSPTKMYDGLSQSLGPSSESGPIDLICVVCHKITKQVIIIKYK